MHICLTFDHVTHFLLSWCFPPKKVQKIFKKMSILDCCCLFEACTGRVQRAAASLPSNRGTHTLIYIYICCMPASPALLLCHLQVQSVNRRAVSLACGWFPQLASEPDSSQIRFIPCKVPSFGFLHWNDVACCAPCAQLLIHEFSGAAHLSLGGRLGLILNSFKEILECGPVQG